MKEVKMMILVIDIKHGLFSLPLVVGDMQVEIQRQTIMMVVVVLLGVVIEALEQLLPQ